MSKWLLFCKQRICVWIMMERANIPDANICAKLHTHTHTCIRWGASTCTHIDTGVTWSAGQELQIQIHIQIQILHIQDAGLSARNFGLLMAKRGSAKHFWKCVTGTDWLSPAEDWGLRAEDQGRRTKERDWIPESFGRSQHLLVVLLPLLQTSAAGNTLTNAASTYGEHGCSFEQGVLSRTSPCRIGVGRYHLPTILPLVPRPFSVYFAAQEDGSDAAKNSNKI